MSDTRCPFIKPDGDPCAAHPLSNSDFCLFHDPAQVEAQTAARRKGGSAPRRRTRRFPRLLDHVHVAELLGELFVDSLNNPDAIDTKRLHALANLSRALLKAVGTPPTFLIHEDRREPSPAAGHLLRVYPPLPPEVAALLEAEPSSCSEPQNAPAPAQPDAQSPNTDSQDPGFPRARMPELRTFRAYLPGVPSLEIGDYDAWLDAVFFCAPDPAPAPDPIAVPSTTPDATFCPPGVVPATPSSHPSPAAPACPEAAEQELNRSGTGLEQVSQPQSSFHGNPPQHFTAQPHQGEGHAHDTGAGGIAGVTRSRGLGLASRRSPAPEPRRAGARCVDSLRGYAPVLQSGRTSLRQSRDPRRPVRHVPSQHRDPHPPHVTEEPSGDAGE
jgi:hypothetical protein